MRVELGPGEWAGVLDVLRERAAQLREAPLVDDEPHELADDYERIAGIIRTALAENGRYTVYERQVITYAWEVEVPDGEDPGDGSDYALDGVPQDARTVRFASENWIEPASGT